MSDSSGCVEIIHAGQGRTGTFSVIKALELLGYKCYHMHECLKNNDWDLWIQAYDCAKNKNKNNQLFDYNKIFNGKYNLNKTTYHATFDFPASMAYNEISKEYPNAKVILTVREFDKWYVSNINTIFELTKTIRNSIFYYLLPNLRKSNDFIWDEWLKWGGYSFNDTKNAKNVQKIEKMYNDWNNHFQNQIDYHCHRHCHCHYACHLN